MRAWLPIVFLSACACLGQGTFIYDQQSSTYETPYPYGSGSTVQNIITPWGQSFTPSLSGIDFIKLMLLDGNTVDTAGATFDVRLRSGSISGAVIGTSASVSMPNGFTGVATFQFPSTVSLNAGTVYYFEPVVESGGTWNIIGGSFNYPGGSVFVAGGPQLGGDLWFREGIIVPEPSSLALLTLAGSWLFCSKRLIK